MTVTLPLDQRYAFRYLTDCGSRFDDPDIQLTTDSPDIVVT